MLHLCVAIVVGLTEIVKNHTMRPRIIHLSSVHSTNTYLAGELKKASLPQELAVIADYQEGGKGQGGNRWYSPPGKNLLMSILLFPAFLSASSQFHLSRVVSLALVDTLKGYGQSPVIKWPNDILAGGKKIAGILIENGIVGTGISHTIMGIGLNLNQQEFPEYPLPATSLLLETGKQREPLEVAERLLDAIMARYGQLESGSAALLEREYLEHLYSLDRPGEFLAEGERFRGIIRGVNHFGELLVEREGETRSYGFQDISFTIHKSE
jgi:BirA family biotin operon repressor/biotin-[acetyl-CoA-carboxylase] ligase